MLNGGEGGREGGGRQCSRCEGKGEKREKTIQGEGRMSKTKETREMGERAYIKRERRRRRRKKKKTIKKIQITNEQCS